MAKILIIDDEEDNRQLLSLLFEQLGHEVLEASDGVEALILARSQQPDLIISDILMPTMDGYEFVRRLRADSNIRQCPVIFITGAHLGREARALAKACGVFNIIYRPFEKEKFLLTVEAALQCNPPESLSPKLPLDEFECEYLKDQLSEEVDELTALNHKLTALIGLSQLLASEHDPSSVLKKFSYLARAIIGARWNAVGLVDAETQTLQQFYTIGLSAEKAALIDPQSLFQGVFAESLKEGHPCRIRIRSGDLRAAGLPPDFPAISSCLSLPIIFRDNLYGTFCLGDKLGAAGFSDVDEKLAVTLVGQMAVALENATLYRESQLRTIELEEKMLLSAQIADQQQRVNSIISNVPGIVWTTWFEPSTAKQQVNYVSDFVETLLGYSVEEWLATPEFWLTIVHPEDRDRAATTSASHFARGESYSQEFRWIARDGHIVWVATQVSVITDSEGKHVGMRGVNLDITEQKEAEIELRTSRDRYESLVHSIDGIVWEMDVNTLTFTFVSQRAFPLLGYPLQQWNDEPDFWLNHLHPDDKEWAMDLRSSHIKEEANYQLDYRMIAMDGRVVWLRDFVTFDTTKPGQVLLHGVMVDITSTKRAEAEREVIFEVIEGVVTTRNMEELLKLIHRSISKILYAENCFVALIDPSSGLMDFEFWVDQRDPVPPPKTRDNGFSQYVLHTNEPLLLSKKIRTQLAKSGKVKSVGSRSASWLGVPLRTEGRVIGVLVVQHYTDEKAYSQNDLNFLRSVADQIALAIDRKRAEAENERLLHDVGERVKELTALHRTSESLRIQTKGCPELLEEISEHLRVAYQYPDITAVRIKVGDEVYETANFVRTEWIQRVNFVMDDGQDGSIEVVYLDARANEAEGPFLSEKRSLINSVAEMLRSTLESKRTDLALRSSEERYRDMVENALDIIFTLDLEGKYTSVNYAGELITGYTREETLAMHIVDTLAPSSRENAVQMIAYNFGVLDQSTYELEIIAKDGHIVTVEVITRLTYENGVPTGVQGIARDISSRKLAEEALRVSEDRLRQSHKLEAIGQLAGGIAHDFNNLLTVISGYSDLALRRLQKEDPLRLHIEEIKKAGDRAATLTRQLLAFSRKQVLEPKVLDINAIVTDVDNMLQRLIGADVKLITSLDPEVGQIHADPGHIEQVILNLVVNARDAMPGGGRLTIETANVYLDDNYTLTHDVALPGRYVMLAVTDTGCGMDAKTQAQIFDPFFTTKEPGKGTGLGLSTVYGIVKQSCGNIWVYSEVGKGTTFKIYLPLFVDSPTCESIDQSQDDLPQGKELVLIAEDEDQVRTMARGILEMSGYTVMEAINGVDALATFKKYRDKIDLIITDAIMPHMGGRELVENVRRIKPGVKVIFTSGYTEDSVVRRGLLDQKTRFLEKPFTTQALMRKVREVLDASRPEQDLVLEVHE